MVDRSAYTPLTAPRNLAPSISCSGAGWFKPSVKLGSSTRVEKEQLMGQGHWPLAKDLIPALITYVPRGSKSKGYSAYDTHL